MQNEKEKSITQISLEIVTAILALLVVAALLGVAIGVTIKVAKLVYA